MSTELLDSVLERLTRGDAAAAEAVFRNYEPYLRMVVRRQLTGQLRAKFDSIDIVQSVWSDVLEHFRDADYRFTDVNHLRAFLVKATRNRFLDRVRRHRRAVEQEQPWHGEAESELGASAQPRPSQVAQADELWQRMLDACPPNHHEILRLKRQGCSLAEIAEQTGFHPSSIRRILYDLSRKLAVPRNTVLE